jgi:sulfotransferase 6B1
MSIGKIFIFVSFFLILNLATIQKSEGQIQRPLNKNPFLTLNKSPLAIKKMIRGNPFFVQTIPKSGSHLLIKLLTMLTSKQSAIIHDIIDPRTLFLFYPDFHIESEVLEGHFFHWEQMNQFPLAHFNFSEFLQFFYTNHPEYVAIINIRDLRDVYVSLIDFWGSRISEIIDSNSNDEKLTYLINGVDEKSSQYIFNLELHILRALEWLDDPNVIVIRFEDLVGPEGNGSLQRSKDTIIQVANALSIPLTEKRLDYLANNLWGIEKGLIIPYTFFQGKIGRWKEYFNEEHKKLFKEKYGDILIRLGYEQDYNW